MKHQDIKTYAACILLALTTTGLAQAAAKKNLSTTGNGWSGATTISPICQPDPRGGGQLNDVAVNASGVAIAAWDQYTYNYGGNATIGVATQSGGKWSAPFTITSTNGFSMSPRVAVGADGTMAVSWTYQDPATQINPQQKIQVAVKPAGSTTWTTTTLAQGAVGGVAILQLIPLAVDANGNVTAVWSLWNGSIHVVQSATLPKGGGWSVPANLAPGVDGMYPQLALNSRGDAGVSFTISAYAPYGTGTSAQYVYRSGLDGSWTTPVVVSEILMPWVGYVTSPLVALDGNGLATVAYFAFGVEAVRQVSSTQWTVPQVVLSTPVSGASYMSIDLGADQSGNAVLATSIFDPTVGVDRSSVWTSIGTPAGAWSPQQRLTDPTVPVDAYATRVAVSPDGALVFVGWIDHYHGTVQVSKLVNGIWGAADTIGKGTAVGSFREVLGLDIASGTVARAVWKNAKVGTITMAASYGK